MRPAVVHLLALLAIVSPAPADQATAPRSLPTAPRPVTDVSEAPKASDIALWEFRFQQPTFLHGGPGLFPIEGEPTIGARYAVEAWVHGLEAVATASFEAVDEYGVTVERVTLVKDTAIDSRFVGMMSVPAHPFRIVLRGESIDGEPFLRTGDRLFRPVYRQPAPPRASPALPPEEARMVQQIIDEVFPRIVDEVEAQVAASSGVIVMPRMQVSNVTYSPLLSPQGGPTGVRISYDVRFSETGQYNAGIAVEAEYTQPGWQGLTRMTVLDSRITPMPRNAYPPFDEVVFSEIWSSPLQANPRFTFEGNTRYHFTADLVPDFIVHNLEKSRSCVYYRRFRYQPKSRTPFQGILANEAPTSYLVSIGKTAFKGRIEGYYGEGTFHRSFVAEGARDCGEDPSRRF